jgi:addiction module RelE/StbE family toxin
VNVKTITYHPDFLRDLRRLPETTVQRAIKAEERFRDNPMHPSLRMHALKGKLAGLWSISLTRRDRIIFQRMDDGTVMFLSVGAHDIYRSL